MTTFDIHTISSATGLRVETIGLVAAETADAAMEHAAKLMDYGSAAEMLADYARAARPSQILATVTDQPARYTA